MADYNSIIGLSGPAFQTLVFYTANSGWYDIQYICESLPWTSLTDYGRRISRVRYLTGTQTLFDKYFAKNTYTANVNMASYWKWTADFIFKITDEATVKALTYGA